MGFWRATTVLVVVQAMSILSFARDMTIINYGEKNSLGITNLLRSEEEIKQLFEEWMVMHDKSYNTHEEKMSRFDIFKDNLQFIDEHNDPRHNHTYTLGLNHFSDLTNEEYRATYLRKFNLSELVTGPISNRYKAGRLDQLPASVDWRDQGAVAPVKTQGVCESCWAFSAVSTVESLNQIMTGDDLITLSEQELVDCDASNNGCHRGFPHKAYRYMINTGGIETEASYPYISQNGVEGACRMNKAKVVSIDRYEYGPMNSEHSMKKALASQTISVAVESAGRAFQNYKSGIFHGHCGTAIDHAVVLVGYGTDRSTTAGADYWILRNSWSEKWGEKGYMRIQRNSRSREGRCGIAKYFTYPVKHVFPKKIDTA